jgi:hypothetical protein
MLDSASASCSEGHKVVKVDTHHRNRGRDRVSLLP